MVSLTPSFWSNWDFNTFYQVLFSGASFHFTVLVLNFDKHARALCFSSQVLKRQTCESSLFFFSSSGLQALLAHSFTQRPHKTSNVNFLRTLCREIRRPGHKIDLSVAPTAKKPKRLLCQITLIDFITTEYGIRNSNTADLIAQLFCN